MTKSYSEFLIEKGFSTKRSNLSKYYDQMKNDLRIGWEVEINIEEGTVDAKPSSEEGSDTYEHEWQLSGQAASDLADLVDSVVYPTDDYNIPEKFKDMFFDALHEVYERNPDLFETDIDEEDEDLVAAEKEARTAITNKRTREVWERDNTNLYDFFSNFRENDKAFEAIVDRWRGKFPMMRELDSVNHDFTKMICANFEEGYNDSHNDGRELKVTAAMLDDVDFTNRYGMYLTFSYTLDYTIEFESGGEADFEDLKDYAMNVFNNSPNSPLKDVRYKIVSDGSLDDETGIEVVSQLFDDFDKGFNTLIDFLKFLDRRNEFFADDKTGLHVSISFKDRAKEKQIDWIKHGLLSGVDGIMRVLERDDNTYVSTLKKVVAKALEGEDVANDMNKLSQAVFKQLGAKYNYANLGQMEWANGRIEFRLFGGEQMLDYEQTKRQIMQVLAALYASMDPEAYKKEYFVRLAKLLNKGSDPSKALKNTAALIKKKQEKFNAYFIRYVNDEKVSYVDYWLYRMFERSSHQGIEVNPDEFLKLFARLPNEFFTGIVNSLQLERHSRYAGESFYDRRNRGVVKTAHDLFDTLSGLPGRTPMNYVYGHLVNYSNNRTDEDLKAFTTQLAGILKSKVPNFNLKIPE